MVNHIHSKSLYKKKELYAVLHQLRKVIRHSALLQPTLDGALEVSQFLGILNWQNNDGVLDDDCLEQKLFDKHIKKKINSIWIGKKPTKKFDWVHIITHALEIGGHGHTRLLENINIGLKAKGFSQAICITGSAPEIFKSKAEEKNIKIYELIGSPSSRMRKLIAIGQGAKSILLYIHPYDIVAALAARFLRDGGCRILFVNHADHVFSYGINASDVVLEISGYGWNLTSKRRKYKKHSFLGIPIDIHRANLRKNNNDFILSIGQSIKYRPVEGFSNFQEFLIKILAKTDHNFELIGPQSTDPWWTEVLLRYPKRLLFRGPLSYSETMMRLKNCLCYIDSFPENGGTVFSEALMSGKTVFGLGIDGGGYSISEILYCDQMDKFINRICDFLKTLKEPKEQNHVRKILANDFSVSAVTERLISAKEGRLLSPPSQILHTRRDNNYHINMWRNIGKINLLLSSAKNLGLLNRCRIASLFLKTYGLIKLPNKYGKKRIVRWIIFGK